MNEEGVWRTIGGHRIFIRTKQSLSEAMKESGKYKIKKDEKEDKDYSKYKIDKDAQGKVIIKDENGNEVNMLSTKEYNKVAEDFANSLDESETTFLQDYVDCPGWSGELNASTEDGKGFVKYMYNDTNNDYLTTPYERFKYRKEKADELEQKFGISDVSDLRKKWEDEEVKQWFKDNGFNTESSYGPPYKIEDYVSKTERGSEEYKSPEEIAKAKQIYSELAPISDKFAKYEYGSEEYKQAQEDAQKVREKYGIVEENKSAYYYQQIAEQDTKKVFDDIKYDLDALERDGNLKWINAKQLRDVDKNKMTYQSTDFIERKKQLNDFLNKTNNVFNNKGVKLDHDIVLFRRGRETEEQIRNGFKMEGITSTTYKDSLPKKMPSGVSFGDKEYYIILPKGTKVCFTEKVIGRGLKSTPESEKSWNQVRRQHEVILKPETTFKYIDTTTIPGKNWYDNKEVVLLVAEEV